MITQIRWHKEDLEAKLIDKGFDPSPNNIQKLLDAGVVNALQNVLVEYGNEVIEFVIDGTDGLERKEWRKRCL